MLPILQKACGGLVDTRGDLSACAHRLRLCELGSETPYALSLHLTYYSGPQHSPQRTANALQAFPPRGEPHGGGRGAGEGGWIPRLAHVEV